MSDKKTICIDYDLLIEPLIPDAHKKSYFKNLFPKQSIANFFLEHIKSFEDFQSKHKSIREWFVLTQLCYFMVRTAFMSSTRFTKKERTEYILPIAQEWANRVFFGNKKDYPIWIYIVLEHFKDLFGNTTASIYLKSAKIDIKYTKIPILKAGSNGQLVISVALLHFLMQINYSYIFCMKIVDNETRHNEILQKMIPLLAFQSDPASISIAGLPVLYGLDKTEVEFGKRLSLFQIYYMILHEFGHLDRGHTLDKQPELKINSAVAPKEIEADIYAYSILETFPGEEKLGIASAIVAFLSFCWLAEEIKCKMLEREDSPKQTEFYDRIYLAKINLRHFVDVYGDEAIDKTSFDEVERAAQNYTSYALYPLGIVQQAIHEMSVDEIKDLFNKYTDEGITKYSKENKDAGDCN
ncbi:MAG: hypothetical protein J1E83_14605 [Lachnospiraceae bacterium]|nr:hypothetical protein [Lachnospiraceae bacterium]